MSASIYAFTDRGIILAIEDCMFADGYASIVDIGTALGLEEDLRGLSTRLSWMSRYGMVKRHKKDKPSRWAISRRASTALGEADGAITAIEHANGVQFVLLRRTIEHYRRGRA